MLCGVMAENKRDGQVRQYVRVSETAADDVVGSSEEAQRAVAMASCLR